VGLRDPDGVHRPVGAFFYVLGCREPLRGTHERYVAVRWRQVLGSTMHCVAGDGIDVIVGAAIGAGLALWFRPDFQLEYALGFGFRLGLLVVGNHGQRLGFVEHAVRGVQSDGRPPPALLRGWPRYCETSPMTGPSRR
jgi:hypothetical protein